MPRINVFTLLEIVVPILNALIVCIGLMRMFIKMDIPWWKAFIPIYNIYLLFNKVWDRIAFFEYIGISVMGSIVSYVQKGNSNFAINTIIPGILLVIWIIFSFALADYIAKSFEYKWVMKILIVLFPYLASLIIGFGKHEYIGNFSIKEKYI